MEQQPTATAVENLPGFDAGAGDRWIYPTNYPVRKYQRTIVETCLFRNTLVSLPTGLGEIFSSFFCFISFYWIELGFPPCSWTTRSFT